MGQVEGPERVDGGHSSSRRLRCAPCRERYENLGRRASESANARPRYQRTAGTRIACPGEGAAGFLGFRLFLQVLRTPGPGSRDTP
jgi:hypothetical protein